MGIKIDLERSVQENAGTYYNLAKKMRKKSEGVESAILDTKKKIKKARKKEVKVEKKVVRIVRKKEWYESYEWSFTNSGKLVLMGRSAKENDAVVAKYFEEGDLFFHADIRGGSATILKGGIDAGEEDKEFAAILSVCFSKAWGRGFAVADTYSATREQVSKHLDGGFVAAGGFAISGTRTWYRNTPLKLRIGIDEKNRIVVGAPSADWMKRSVVVVPGKMAKGEGVKKLAKILDADPTEIQSMLPAGSLSIEK